MFLIPNPSLGSLTQVQGAVDREVGVDHVDVVALDQFGVVLFIQWDAGLGDVVGGVANVRVVTARLHLVITADGTGRD